MAEPDAPSTEPDWEAFYRDYRKPGYVAGFEITSRLGGGASGLVFRARKESIGKDYAIKFLKVEDQEVRQAVLRELEQVRLFAQVDHPNLVQIEDRGEVDGIPFLVMQYAGSETLRDRMPAAGVRPSPDERDQLLHYFLQACRGVAALHERSLVHFDLKPANVFLKGPVARVGDYGLSKLVTHSRGSLTMGRGTPYYMAPEMLQRRGDHRSDIYSLGVVLYELLCGQPPFRGDSEWEVLHKHEKERPDLPAHLGARERAAIARCLQKDPALRFQSAHDLIAALGAPLGVAGAAAADPYQGFAQASREAYQHARQIARRAAVQVQEFANKAKGKARELVGQVRAAKQTARQACRDERERRRAARRAARAAAWQRRGRRLRGIGVALAVLFLVTLLVPVAFMAGPRVVSSRTERFGPDMRSVPAPPTLPWPTRRIALPDGAVGLFPSWSAPESVAGLVATAEPQWVAARLDSLPLARTLLARQLEKFDALAARLGDPRQRVGDLPRFVVDAARARAVEPDVRRFAASDEVDAEVARRLADGAPLTLAVAARLLGECDGSANGRARAQRLQQLLIDRTQFGRLPLCLDGVSGSRARTVLHETSGLWQWYLHEVGLTAATWAAYREICAATSR